MAQNRLARIHPISGWFPESESLIVVVAEYQDYLEKQWNEKMHNEYPMKVNEKVFKSMVK